ncbi:Flp pilus assembly protein CpaB [Bordetella sp. 2513F-2]
MNLPMYIGLARAFGGYAFAAVAGLTAAWAVHEHIRQRTLELEAESRVPTMPRLVAAHDLPAGASLQADQLAVRDVPEPWAASASLAPEQLHEVEGAILAVALKAGEPVMSHQVLHAQPVRPMAEQLGAGRRAISLPLAEIRNLPPHVRPEDRIDLYASFAHEGRQVVVPLLQGSRVLAMEPGEDGAQLEHIALEASQADAMKVIAARQAGELTAVLRANDAQPETVAAAAAGTPRDLAGLLGLNRATPQGPRPVRIIYGDRLDGADMPDESPVQEQP